MKNKYTITKAEVLALGFKENQRDECYTYAELCYNLEKNKWLSFKHEINNVIILKEKKGKLKKIKVLTLKQVIKKINKHIAKNCEKLNIKMVELADVQEYEEVKKDFIKMTDKMRKVADPLIKLEIERLNDELSNYSKGSIIKNKEEALNEFKECVKETSINNNGIEKSTEIVDELENQKDVYKIGEGEFMLIETKGNVPKMHNPPPPPPPIKKKYRNKSLRELRELLRKEPLNTDDYSEIKRAIGNVKHEIKTENARQSKLTYTPKFSISKLNYFKWSIFIAILIWLYIGVNNMLEQKHYHLATVLSFALGFVMYDVLFTIKKEITEWKNKAV